LILPTAINPIGVPIAYRLATSARLYSNIFIANEAVVNIDPDTGIDHHRIAQHNVQIPSQMDRHPVGDTVRMVLSSTST